MIYAKHWWPIEGNEFLAVVSDRRMKHEIIDIDVSFLSIELIKISQIFSSLLSTVPTYSETLSFGMKLCY